MCYWFGKQADTNVVIKTRYNYLYSRNQFNNRHKSIVYNPQIIYRINNQVIHFITNYWSSIQPGINISHDFRGPILAVL